MATPFIFPSITSLPAGYDCAISIPTARILSKTRQDGVIECRMRVFCEGEVRYEHEFHIERRNGRFDLDRVDFNWPNQSEQWGKSAGFLEIGFRSADDLPLFRNFRVIPFYAIYSMPGKKSFFSDSAFRYGSPPIINQIARFGRYVDTYPVVHLNRERDLGETLALINPYEKAILSTIETQDGRKIKRRRVEPNSVLNVRLSELLEPDEAEWRGQIQLHATNRLVTFHIKHSFRDPTIISDHEHLDPFRSDETHYPITQLARLRFGEFLKARGWI